MCVFLVRLIWSGLVWVGLVMGDDYEKESCVILLSGAKSLRIAWPFFSKNCNLATQKCTLPRHYLSRSIL